MSLLLDESKRSKDRPPRKTMRYQHVLAKVWSYPVRFWALIIVFSNNAIKWCWRNCVTKDWFWACVVAVFTYKLWVVNERLTDIANKADETTRLRDRAYLYFDSPKMVAYPPANFTHFGFSNILRNMGNMPARNVRLRTSLVFADARKDVAEPYSLLRSTENFQENSFVLGPKQEVPFQCGDISIQEYRRVLNKQLNIYLISEVAYTDGFDSILEHRTQATQWLNIDKAGGYSFTGLGKHNCADNDCPK